MQDNFPDVILRKAEVSDFEFFYAIKSEINDILWTGHTGKPDHDQLLSWFERNITENPLREILIIEQNKSPVGYIYVDKIDKNLFELAIGVSENHSGKHIGRTALAATVKMIRKPNPDAMIIAWIREDNIASQKAFSNADFTITDDYLFRFIGSLGVDKKMIKFVNYPSPNNKLEPGSFSEVY